MKTTEHNAFPDGRFALPKQFSGVGAEEPAARPDGDALSVPKPGGQSGAAILLPKILLPGEANELAYCELIIERGLETFVEVGEALRIVRDKRLYRTTDGTFEAYVERRFGMSVRQAYRLCEARDVIRNLVPPTTPGGVNNCSPLALPATASQTRPLAALAPDEQRAAWAEAVATAPNGRVTEKHVAEVVRKRKGDLPVVPVPADSPAAPREASSGSPPIGKRGRVKMATEKAIASLRELLVEIGTADSAPAAELNVALEAVETFQDHLESVETMQASRV